MKRWIIWLFPLVLLMACNENTDEGHSHGEESHSHDNGESELTIDTTIWTDEVELFVEYPVFIKGHTTGFTAHFTRIDGHRPVTEGTVTVSLIKGKKGIRHTVESPSSPGIFTPALQPKEAGEYQLVFELKAAGLDEQIKLGPVQVYPDHEAATHAIGSRQHEEPEISFLKEQAWNIDFQTVAARLDTIYGIVKASGKWMPTPGTQRTLNAASSGNVLFETPSLVEGKEVSKGQALMRISGEDLNVSSIESEIRKAKAEFEQAQSAYERKKELFELKVVPEAEFEEVTKRYEVAQANYQQLLKNYGTNGIAIRAPFDGYIKSISVENGGFANAGQPLLIIGSEQSRLIKATIPPSAREKATQTTKVWIIEEGQNRPVKGRVISVGRNVTEEHPMLPVFIEIQSPVPAVQGSLAEVQLGYTTGKPGLVIPRNALLEDFGTYKVVVQTGGEAYEIRPVKIGAFNGDKVSITEGLKEGDWVVTTGAYQVKMASMSGSAPAHGHTH